MKPRDIIKEKKTRRIGFITSLRPDLDGNCVNVQFVCDMTNISENWKDTYLNNMGCFSTDELELLIPALNETT